MKNRNETLTGIYARLLRRYGPQQWWPGDSPFEVMVGAILTQSAAWQNVEKAIINLKTAGVMSPSALRDIPTVKLAELVYPTGYYHAKALKLQALVRWLGEACGDNLNELWAMDTGRLRQEILNVYGIGPETADSILLYAGNKPVFVIDAYTRRISGRLGLLPEKSSYAELQKYFTLNLPQNTELFNEYHALLVRHGKEACKKLPVCEKCCLQTICRFSS